MFIEVEVTMFELAARLFDKHQLLKKIKEQRWFAQQNRDISSINILDWVLVPPFDSSVTTQSQLYWMKVEVAETHCYSILVHCGEDGMEDGSQATGLIEQLKLVGKQGLITAKGAKISLNGDITNEVITSIKAFEGSSSNTLQRCATQENDYVIKSYRLLGESNKNEVDVLTSLYSYYLTPKVVGQIEYDCSDVDGVEYLAVLTEFLHETPVHILYSASIRKLISGINNGNKSLLLNLEKIEKLCPLSCKIGQQIKFFHKHLNNSYQDELSFNASDFELSTYLKQSLQRWSRVCQAVENDQTLLAPYRKQVLLQLTLCAEYLLQNVAQESELRFPVSIAHGDLHLAHVFIDAAEHQQCRIIDPSPISLNATDKHFNTQHSLMDLVGIHRGIEYFSFDEIIDAIALQLNKTECDVSSLLLHQPDELSKACPALFSLLGNWSEQVFSQIFSAYDNAEVTSNLKEKNGALLLYNTFYFGRLLKELDYNYAYGRQFFKLCDLYYLSKLTDALNT